MSKKEAIIQAAIKLFAEKSFKGASTAELSALTHVAESTIFYHFKSKEDLLIQVLARIKEEIIEEFQQYRKINQPASGFEKLEEAVGFYLYLAGKLEDPFLLLHRRYLYELAEVNATCREHLKEIYDCLVDIFEQAILSAQQDGTAIDASARRMALLIFTMVDGLVRFKNFNLYDAGALYPELIAACHRMLAKSPPPR
jgi:AcrR family transcriptional regulator